MCRAGLPSTERERGRPQTPTGGCLVLRQDRIRPDHGVQPASRRWVLQVKRPAAAAAAAAETSGVPKKGSSIQAHRSSSGQGFASTGPRARPQQRLSAARSSGATGSEPTERPDRRHSISAHRPVPKPQPPEAQPARESLSRAGPETASMFAALPAGCYPVAGHTHPWYPPGRGEVHLCSTRCTPADMILCVTAPHLHPVCIALYSARAQHLL